MGKSIDLTGQKFGEWTVLKRSEKATSGNYKWLCRCSCGTEKDVDGNSLRSGKSTKCRQCAVPHNRTKYTGDSIQTTFSGMKARCYDGNHKSYDNYGGRGIKIYTEWLNDPTSFYNWAYENGYDAGMTIERIDSDEGYNPSNCKFIPLKEQSSNRRSNNYIDIGGQVKTLSEWCRIYKINRNTVKSRIRRGMTPEEALKTKILKNKDS